MPELAYRVWVRQRVPEANFGRSPVGPCAEVEGPGTEEGAIREQVREQMQVYSSLSAGCGVLSYILCTLCAYSIFVPYAYRYTPYRIYRFTKNRNYRFTKTVIPVY
jgi:hypothetical protein